MAVRYEVSTLDRPTKAMIAVVVLAVVLVAAVPAAFLAGLILMLFGHIVGGLALFGGSVLAGAAAVALAVFSGFRYVRHLRDMVMNRDFRVLRLPADDYTHQG
jgi:hypothetical protein